MKVCSHSNLSEAYKIDICHTKLNAHNSSILIDKILTIDTLMCTDVLFVGFFLLEMQ